MENTQSAGDTSPHAQDRPGLPRVRLSSPADVLAVVPHLLGFHPSRSFVVIGAGGPRDRVELGFRYDLPDPPDAAAAEDIAQHAVAVLEHRRLTTVIAVGYGPGRLVTPVADALAAAVRRGGPRLRELMRVEDGRYWSYLCRNVTCCPPEGVAVSTRPHPASAAMSAAGLAAYPDRETLASTLAPANGAQAETMDEAAHRACERAAALIAEASGQGSPHPLRAVIDEGRRSVREAIGIYRAGGRITEDDQFAWLALSLANLAVRDDAWARMEPGHRDAHRRLWTDVVRRVGLAWVPAPASLLAFTAWQCGEGALANIAIDRALGADPDYSMALLLRNIIDAGVPPSEARLPMTPEEVEASYAEDGGPAAGPGLLGTRGRVYRVGRRSAGSERGAGRKGSREGKGAAGGSRARSRRQRPSAGLDDDKRGRPGPGEPGCTDIRQTNISR